MFSFISTTQDASTCLRYQLQLAGRRRVSPNQRTLQYPPWRLYLSSTVGRQQTHHQSVEEFPVNDHLHAFFSPLETSRKPDQIVFRRLRLGQQIVPLGVDTLGQPAHIRILREREDLERADVHSPPAKEESLDQGLSPDELLSAISAEAEAKDDDPSKNIEELRRAFTYNSGIVDTPTAVQCHEVAQELHDGFTIQQLEQYLKNTKSDTATDHRDLERRFENTLFTRSAWFTGVSDFPQHAMLRLYPGESIRKRERYIIGINPVQESKQSRKQRIVEDVLRKSWRIRCKEEKLREGEIDIRLGPEHLTLLLNHRTDIFGKISEQLGTKIDISQSQRIIRVTGDYATCSEVSHMIYTVLGEVQFKDLDLQLASEPQKLTTESTSTTSLDAIEDKILFERIEKLTSTHMVPSMSLPNDSRVTKLRVYYLGPDQTDLEDVQRLILQVLKPDASKKIQVQHEQIGISASILKVPVEVGSTLPWTERVNKWVRWKVGSKAKPAPVEGVDLARKTDIAIFDPAKSQHVMTTIASFLLNGRASYIDKENGEHPSEREGEHWERTERHAINATLGHLAYPASLKQSKTPLSQGSNPVSKVERRDQVRQTFLDTMQDRRILVTSLPENFPALRYHAYKQNPNVRHELCVLLNPNRVETDRQIGLGSLPNLYLRLALHNKSQSVELSDVRLVVDERESDLLLLREVADIRFKAHSFLSGISNVDPKIRHFIAESNFDIWGKERLKTPPRLRLSIPGTACRMAPALGAEPSGELVPKDIEVEYAFSRLEHHSHMSVLYQGLRTSYNTIEGGKTGGRRNEICLDSPIVDIGQNGPSSVDAFSPFFNSVREYVARMDQSSMDVEIELDGEHQPSNLIKQAPVR